MPQTQRNAMQPWPSNIVDAVVILLPVHFIHDADEKQGDLGQIQV